MLGLLQRIVLTLVPNTRDSLFRVCISLVSIMRLYLVSNLIYHWFMLSYLRAILKASTGLPPITYGYNKNVMHNSFYDYLKDRVESNILMTILECIVIYLDLDFIPEKNA